MQILSNPISALNICESPKFLRFIGNWGPGTWWYIDLLSISTWHRCCKNFTGCGPWNARSPECIDFKLAVLIYRCLYGLVPWYISDDIQCVADFNRRCLWLSSSQLVIWWTLLSTVGDRAFPVKPPLEQSAARHHLIFNAADCFPEPFQNSFLLPTTKFPS